MTGRAAEPLETLAARLGGYRWMEDRLFQATGRWSADGPHPEVQVHLNGASFEHAWHAELWEERLPVLSHIDQDALTRPPSPAVAALFEAMAEGADLIARLAGLYRVVLPRLIVTYDRHRSVASPDNEAPVVRALTLVRRDEVAQWRAGEQLLQGLLGTPDDLDRVTARQRELEVLVVGSRPGLEAP